MAQSSVSIECRVTSIHRLRGLDGDELNTWMVLGEAVMVHIDHVLLRDGVYDTIDARPILRGGGLADYFEILHDCRFKMFRPK